MLGEFGAFLGVAALVIVTPGQDTALTIRNTLAGGRRAGVFTAVGVVAGQAMWTLASAVGLTALLVASRPAFRVVQLAGAVYLVWLGVHALRRAWSRDQATMEAVTPAGGPGLPAVVALRQGTLSALGNPKLAVFFVSLLQPFVPQNGASLPALLALGATFCAMTLVWLTGYAIVVGKAERLLSRSWLRRALEGVLGGTLVALGFRVATQER